MCNWGQPTRPKCTRVFSRDETINEKKNSDRVTLQKQKKELIKQKRKQETNEAKQLTNEGMF